LSWRANPWRQVPAAPTCIGAAPPQDSRPNLSDWGFGHNVGNLRPLRKCGATCAESVAPAVNSLELPGDPPRIMIVSNNNMMGYASSAREPAIRGRSRFRRHPGLGRGEGPWRLLAAPHKMPLAGWPAHRRGRPGRGAARSDAPQIRDPGAASRDRQGWVPYQHRITACCGAYGMTALADGRLPCALPAFAELRSLI
jgi:hypothetical protein